MNVRETIFDSQSERELFVAIESRWSQRGFVLYPSLPFSNIFNVTKLDVTPEERSFLFKTSIDYTLCTKKDGQPLVSVEFDGISHGFTRHGAYVALREVPSNDPRRHWKLDLKVRLATEANYPLLVVSYHEKNPISKDTHLTIVDGAIGQILADRSFRQRLNDQPVSSVEAVVDLEVEADLEWNPIAKAAALAHIELLDAGIASSLGTSFLDPPGTPTAPFAARVEALNRAVWVGCRVTYNTARGPASADAWVRNLAHAGVHPLGLSEDIATLLAAQRARELFNFTSLGGNVQP